MINWNTNPEELPSIDQKDAWNKKHNISARVLVNFVTGNNPLPAIAFAYYHVAGDHWVIEGYLGGKYTIIAWSELNEPLKLQQEPLKFQQEDGVKLTPVMVPLSLVEAAYDAGTINCQKIHEVGGMEFYKRTAKKKWLDENVGYPIN